MVENPGSDSWIQTKMDPRFKKKVQHEVNEYQKRAIDTSKPTWRMKTDTEEIDFRQDLDSIKEEQHLRNLMA